MGTMFIRVSDGVQEEIIAVRDLVKIYKAEGHDGDAIIYEFNRLHNGETESWREIYPTTHERDEYFYGLVATLCGEKQVPLYRHTEFRMRKADEEYEEELKRREEEINKLICRHREDSANDEA